jgi:hypothetical protein
VNITREWIIASKCPDCDIDMPELSRVQEQHFEDDGTIPEQTFLISTLVCNTKPVTCPQCGVRHDTRNLTPQMIAVEPGTRIPLARRKGKRTAHRVANGNDTHVTTGRR